MRSRLIKTHSGHVCIDLHYLLERKRIRQEHLTCSFSLARFSWMSALSRCRPLLPRGDFQISGHSRGLWAIFGWRTITLVFLQIFVCPACAYSGGFQLLSCRKRSAASYFRLSSASFCAVCPLVLIAFMLAPFSHSNVITESLPHFAASWSGVLFWSSSMSISSDFPTSSKCCKGWNWYVHSDLRVCHTL